MFRVLLDLPALSRQTTLKDSQPLKSPSRPITIERICQLQPTSPPPIALDELSAPVVIADKLGQEMRGSEYLGLALARSVRACADGTLSGLLIGRDAIGCRPAIEHCAAAPERGQCARRKVVRRPTDNIDYPLKLPRCEFGRDLMNGAGFADQQQRRRHRFGCFLFGRPFYPLRIERDAISIAHSRTYPGTPVQRLQSSLDTRAQQLSAAWETAPPLLA